MTVKHVRGDLFELNVDAIGHGVNCRGVMGAGIATTFKEKYPMMYHDYNKLCYMGHLHLGQVFVWAIPHRGTGYYKEVIYNIASQYEPGANADLEALRTAMIFVRFDAAVRGLKSVALPQIGCGIGGLQWNVVSTMLHEILEPSPVEFQLVSYGPAQIRYRPGD